MAYTKHTWVDGSTTDGNATAERMNNIENGIENCPTYSYLEKGKNLLNINDFKYVLNNDGNYRTGYKLDNLDAGTYTFKIYTFIDSGSIYIGKLVSGATSTTQIAELTSTKNTANITISSGESIIIWKGTTTFSKIITKGQLELGSTATDYEEYYGKYITKKDMYDLATYSTTEVDTGKIWIDGKPIYRKVLEFNNVPTGYTAKNHGISNFDKLINCSGYYYNSTWGYIPIPAVTSDDITGYGIGVADFKSTKFSFNIGNLRSSTNEVKLIVEYTKTTHK